MELDSGGGGGDHDGPGIVIIPGVIDSEATTELQLEYQEIIIRARENNNKRLFWLLLIFVLCACVGTASSLKCYHCLERPKSTEKHLSCAYFDKSDKFHKECTHSSFCMKRTSQFQLHNGSYVTIHVHKCADQSHKTMIQDSNGDWKWAQLFRRDLYNEGCFPHNTPSMLTTESYHCFCSTDFCNGASKSRIASQQHFILLLLFVSSSTLFYINAFL